jgi:hypothetical protein
MLHRHSLMIATASAKVGSLRACRDRRRQPGELLRRSSGYYLCALVGFRLDELAFEAPLVALRPETLSILKLPLRLLMLKSEKYFMDKVGLNCRCVNFGLDRDSLCLRV